MEGRPKRCPGCKQRNWDAAVGEIPLGRPPKAAGRVKKEPRHIDPEAFRLWGLLKDFERWEFQNRSMKDLLAGMAELMRADSLRIIPELRRWLKIPKEATHKADAV